MKTPSPQEDKSHKDEDRKPSAAAVADGAIRKARNTKDLEGDFATANYRDASSSAGEGHSTIAMDRFSFHSPTTRNSSSSKRKFLTFEEAHASIKRLSHEELLRASKQALKQHLEKHKQERSQVDHLQAVVLQERLQEKAHLLAKENPSLSQTLFQLSSLAAGLGRSAQGGSCSGTRASYTNGKVPPPTKTTTVSADVRKPPIDLVQSKGVSNGGNSDSDAVTSSASSGSHSWDKTEKKHQNHRHPLEEGSIRAGQKRKAPDGMECGSSGSTSCRKKASTEEASSNATTEGGTESISSSGQLSSESGEEGASSSGQVSSEGGGGGVSSTTFSNSTQTHSCSVSTDQAVYCNTTTNISDHRVPPFASSSSSSSTIMQNSKQHDYRRQWQQMLEIRPDSTDVKGITEWLLRLFDLATLTAASEAMILPEAESSSSTSSPGSSSNEHEKKRMAAATTNTKSTVATKNDKDFNQQDKKKSPTTKKPKRQRREEQKNHNDSLK